MDQVNLKKKKVERRGLVEWEDNHHSIAWNIQDIELLAILLN